MPAAVTFGTTRASKSSSGDFLLGLVLGAPVAALVLAFAVAFLRSEGNRLANG